MTQISNYKVSSLSPLPSAYSVADLNSRLDTLQKNIEFLGAIMATAREGSALIGFNAQVDPVVQVGQPVYYNTTTKRFELSWLDLIRSAGTMFAGPSSDVWGLVIKKCADDRAHLLLDGVTSVDMTASTGSPIVSGKWYLSRTAGMLQSSPDQILVSPVLLGTGDGDILFRPWFADNFARFVPRTIPISPFPAGLITNAGGITTLSSVNPAIAGWLPASHSVFGGKSPVGARFGYNWSVDPNLRDIWPPIYPDETYLLNDPGGNTTPGYATVVGKDGDRLIVDENGIWWMTDRTTQLPWDMQYQDCGCTTPIDDLILSINTAFINNAGNTQVMLVGGSGSSGAGPLNYPRRLWVEGQFAGQYRSLLETVYSLRSSIPWIDVVRRGTNTEADRGDLELRLDASELVQNDPQDYAGVALKQADPSGKLTQGPVVTSIRVSGAGLSILGGNDLGNGVWSGQLTLAVNANKDFDILPLRVQLFGATTEAYRETIGIGLRPSIDSNFVTEFHVPHALVGSHSLQFRLWLLAPEAMTLPQGITASYMRLQRATSVAQSVGSFNSLTISYPTSNSLNAGTYVSAITGAISVSGGDTVYLRVSRAGKTDGVNSMVTVLKVIGEFV
ncbi:MAG: hypothetical protein KatS3mg109_0013 [Pirellulaceae bacterium]|nr:MAG: hypothetical protein KatS3mg109_0013 [Pirellulaceae bacterium]